MPPGTTRPLDASGELGSDQRHGGRQTEIESAQTEKLPALQLAGPRPRADVHVLPAPSLPRKGPKSHLVDRRPRPGPTEARLRPVGLLPHARTRPHSAL